MNSSKYNQLVEEPEYIIQEKYKEEEDGYNNDEEKEEQKSNVQCHINLTQNSDMHHQMNRYYKFGDPLEIKQQILMEELMKLNLQPEKLRYIFENQVNVGSMPFEDAKQQVLNQYFSSKHMVLQKINKTQQKNSRFSLEKSKQGIYQFLDIATNLITKVFRFKKESNQILEQEVSSAGNSINQMNNRMQFSNQSYTMDKSFTRHFEKFQQKENQQGRIRRLSTIQANSKDNSLQGSMLQQPKDEVRAKRHSEYIQQQHQDNTIVIISKQCNHEYLLNDLREYLNYQILSQKNINISCPAQDCPVIIQKEKIRYITSNEVQQEYDFLQKQAQRYGRAQSMNKKKINNSNIQKTHQQQQLQNNSFFKNFSNNNAMHRKQKNSVILEAAAADQEDYVPKMTISSESSYDSSDSQSEIELEANGQLMFCPECNSKIKRLSKSNKQACANCGIDVCWECRNKVEDHSHYEGIKGCRIFEDQPNFVRLNVAIHEHISETVFQNEEEIKYEKKIKQENLFCLIIKYILTCTVFGIHREQLNHRYNVKQIEKRVEKMNAHVEKIIINSPFKSFKSISTQPQTDNVLERGAPGGAKELCIKQTFNQYCQEQNCSNENQQQYLEEEQLHKIFNIHDCKDDVNQNYYTKYPWFKYLWEIWFGQGLGDNLRTLLFAPVILIVGHIIIFLFGFFFWFAVFYYKLQKKLLLSIIYSVILYLISVLLAMVLSFPIAQYIMGHNTMEYYEKIHDNIEDNIKEDFKFFDQYTNVYKQYNSFWHSNHHLSDSSLSLSQSAISQEADKAIFNTNGTQLNVSDKKQNW